MRNSRHKKTDARNFDPVAKVGQRANHNKRSNKKRPIKHEENPVMRAAELRKMLGIGKNTIYDWCNQGIIPHKRVGQLIFISRKKFYEWLENGENLGGVS